MTQEDYRHPIAPLPELVQQWLKEFYGAKLQYVAEASIHLAARAAQWGADQELEACCEWLGEPEHARRARGASELRDARRPKQPSLKEQALEALDRMDQFPNLEDRQIVRRALEQLDD